MNERQDRLLNLLEEYQTLHRQGRAVSAAELCDGDADLATELQRLIDTEQHIARLADDGGSAPETVAPSVEYETLSPLSPGEPTEAVPATDRYEVRAKLG